MSCVYFILKLISIVKNVLEKLYWLILSSFQFSCPKILKTHLPRFWLNYTTASYTRIASSVTWCISMNIIIHGINVVGRIGSCQQFFKFISPLYATTTSLFTLLTFLNNVFDIWSKGIILSTKINLIFIVSDISFFNAWLLSWHLSASRKASSTFLCLCPLPIK